MINSADSEFESNNEMTTKHNSNSFDNAKSSQSTLVSNRKESLRNFDQELKRLHAISAIESKLKRTNTDPKSLLVVNTERSWLDRFKVPRKLKLCKIKLNFFTLLWYITVIDFFLCLKYVIMLLEKISYSADYPPLVFIDVVLKGII